MPNQVLLDADTGTAWHGWLFSRTRESRGGFYKHHGESRAQLGAALLRRT